jgi:hypothetical protein
MSLITDEHSCLVITRTRDQFPIRWPAILTRVFVVFLSPSRLPVQHLTTRHYRILPRDFQFNIHKTPYRFKLHNLFGWKIHSPANRINSSTNYQRLKGASLLLILREPTDKAPWPGLGHGLLYMVTEIWVLKLKIYIRKRSGALQ